MAYELLSAAFSAGRAANEDVASPRLLNRLSDRSSEREYQRSALSLPLVVCGLNASGRIFFELASTYDISRSGCRLHLCTQPQHDSPLAIRVISNKGEGTEESAQILFQVAWLLPEAEGWAVGAHSLGDTDLRTLVFPSHTT
jgi:hypothetical protein